MYSCSVVTARGSLRDDASSPVHPAYSHRCFIAPTPVTVNSCDGRCCNCTNAQRAWQRLYIPACLPGWLVLVTIKKYRVRYSLVRPWYLNTNYAPAAIPICCGQLPSLMRKTRSSCAEALCLSRRKPSEICQVGGSSRRVACAVGDRSTRRLISECTDTCRSPCIWLWTGVRTTSYAVQYLCVPGY